MSTNPLSQAIFCEMIPLVRSDALWTTIKVDKAAGSVWLFVLAKALGKANLYAE